MGGFIIKTAEGEMAIEGENQSIKYIFAGVGSFVKINGKIIGGNLDGAGIGMDTVDADGVDLGLPAADELGNVALVLGDKGHGETDFDGRMKTAAGFKKGVEVFEGTAIIKAHGLLVVSLVVAVKTDIDFVDP